jgi:hypothetical protein
MPLDSYEDYKFIAADSESIAARCQNLNIVYLTFETFLLGGVVAVTSVFLSPSAPGGLTNLVLVAGLVFACIIGLLVSLAWRNQAGNYKAVLDTRAKKLAEIEGQQGFPGTKLFSASELSGVNPLTGVRGPSRFGDSLAVVFMLAFIVAALGLIASDAGLSIGFLAH